MQCAKQNNWLFYQLNIYKCKQHNKPLFITTFNQMLALSFPVPVPDTLHKSGFCISRYTSIMSVFAKILIFTTWGFFLAAPVIYTSLCSNYSLVMLGWICFYCIIIWYELFNVLISILGLSFSIATLLKGCKILFNRLLD